MKPPTSTSSSLSSSSPSSPLSSSPITSSVLSLIKFYDKSRPGSFHQTGKKVERHPPVREVEQRTNRENNSMDEFLRLVNKTKKKYKELLDVDFESEKESQRIEIDTNLRSSIKKETLADCFLRTEAKMKILNDKCDQLHKEKRIAVNERQKVALMSEDQIDKLHGLERSQGMMEVQNLQLQEDLLAYRLKNVHLMNNIKDLKNQLSLMKEEKENLSREIKSKLNAKEKTKECLSPTFIVEELEKTIAFLEKTIGEHRKEMLDLKETSNKELRVLEEIYEKEKGDLISQISSLQSEVKTVRNEKGKVDISIDLLKEEIRKELENLKLMKKKELKREIKEIKFLLRCSQAKEDWLSVSSSPYVLKLKQRLREALDDAATTRRQNRNLATENQQMEEMVEVTTKARDDLSEKYMELLREHYKSSSELKQSEDEFKQILAKYEKTVSAMSSQQYLLENQSQTIEKLTTENAELEEKLESYVKNKIETGPIDGQKELGVKILNLEANIQFESENCNRLSALNNKLKAKLERAELESANLLRKNEESARYNKTLEKNLRTLRTECLTWKNKELKTQELKIKVEQDLKMNEAEMSSLRQNLDTANRRIKSLQLDIFLNSDQESDLSDEDQFLGE